jgi:hypothetical protein
LLKGVPCTTAALNATGVVPEDGKRYIRCSTSATSASEWIPTDVGSWVNGVLSFYDRTMGADLKYSAADGWVCSNGFHGMVPATIAILEWE